MMIEQIKNFSINNLNITLDKSKGNNLFNNNAIDTFQNTNKDRNISFSGKVETEIKLLRKEAQKLGIKLDGSETVETLKNLISISKDEPKTLFEAIKNFLSEIRDPFPL